VSLAYIIARAFPFAVMMFLVLLILIAYPDLSLILIELGYL